MLIKRESGFFMVVLFEVITEPMGEIFIDPGNSLAVGPSAQRSAATAGIVGNNQGKTFIFLLKGKDYMPVYYGLFIRKLSEHAEIRKILKRKRSQNQ